MAFVRPIGDYYGNLQEFANDDYIHPKVLGTGTPSANTVLDGSGNWVTIASLNYWSLNGADIYRATGNVYIGHSASYGSYKLQVTGDGYYTGNVIINGNLGVGTSSPQQKQHNNISLGGVGVGLMLSNDATNATAGRGVGILFAGTGNANIAQIEAQTLTASNNTGGLMFKTSNAGTLAERVRIDHNGYFGINTTTPQTRLHIGGVGSTLSFDSTGGVSTLLIRTVNDYEFSFYTGRGTTSELVLGNDNVRLYTNSAVRFHVTSSGLVTIGGTTLNGTKLLQVNGGIRQNDVISGLVYANAQGEFQSASQTNLTSVVGGYYIINGTSLQTANFNISGWAQVNSIRILSGSDTNSSFVGSNAGNLTYTGTYNTSFGFETLTALTSGAYNNAFGILALRYNTTGSFNTAFGSQALINNTTGNYNISIGFVSSGGNTTGVNNIAIGTTALYSNVGSSHNIAIGTNALYFRSGTGNTFNIGIGHGSLQGNSTVANNTGTQNTALGAYSLNSHTTGNNNVSIGFYSLINSTTGASNVAVGAYAGQYLTTAANNTLIGFSAGGGGIITGNWNTYIGGSAGGATTSGYSNICIGQGAGAGTTTGYYNIIIGVNGGSSITTGYGNVIIGAMNASRIATMGNTIIFGDGLGNERFFIPSSGNFIINSTTDTGFAKLQVTGAISSSTLTASTIVKADGNKVLTSAASSDIATALGSTHFIQNQYASAQVANAWISGNLKVGGNIIADGYFSGTSSDRRYKSEFKSIKVYDVIDNIDVSSYKHKLYGSRMIGSVAQQIEQYFPELITADGNGYLRVDNYGYAAIALQLGKEIKSEVEILKERVKELEQRLGI